MAFTEENTVVVKDKIEEVEPETTPKPASEGPAVGTRFTADEIYENVRVAAEEELRRPAAALFWSAIAAGLIIGFSFFAGAYLAMLVPEHLAHAAAAAGYPLGFIFVVLARNQLFTENTLEPIIPLLNKPTWKTVRQLLSLWAVVLVGNLIGALIFAWVAARTPMVGPDLRRALEHLAESATSGGFMDTAYRSIFAGWLIALMAWLVASTRSTGAQVLLIWLTTASISAFGFRHSIAGSVEAFFRTITGTAAWGDMIFGFLIPAVIGNIIGGVILVALLNHGQVHAGRAAKVLAGTYEDN